MDIAIIGAGLAGLTFANLCKNQHNIQIFEKARGVGGRMTHRRHADFDFDHGAQYFTVRDSRFSEFLENNCQDVIMPWQARFVSFENGKIARKSSWHAEHFVAVPAMNAVCKKLNTDFEVISKTRVGRVTKENSKSLLYADSGEFLGDFDLVISTAPPLQTLDLIPNACQFKQQVADIKMQSCFTLMLGFNSNPLPDFDVGHILADDLSWVSVNSSKPGRDTLPSVVINSTNKWADANIDADVDFVKSYMFKTADKLLNFSAEPVYQDLQRWRYANIGKQSGPKAFYDPQLQIGACGDWCIKGRVESAFLSALHLYELIFG